MLISQESFYNIVVKPFEAQHIINEANALANEIDVDAYPALKQLLGGLGWVAEQAAELPLSFDYDVPDSGAGPEPEPEHERAEP